MRVNILKRIRGRRVVQRDVKRLCSIKHTKHTSTFFPLQPAALVSVPYGFVLVRVRVRDDDDDDDDDDGGGGGGGGSDVNSSLI